MDEKKKNHISKFLSLVLRHQPETIDLNLNKNGWANISELIEKSKIRNIHFSKEDLWEVVTTNDKQRFAFNDDKSQIRANQGHSIKKVDLKLETVEPPEFLYHGTVEKFISSILENGLLKMERQHVHLSKDIETALKVGSRRGKPIILKIASGKMYEKNYTFFCSQNGVWLTEIVPVEFITLN